MIVDKSSHCPLPHNHSGSYNASTSSRSIWSFIGGGLVQLMQIEMMLET